MRRIIKFFITVIYKIRFAGKCKINALTNIILRNCCFAGNNCLGNHTYLSNTSLDFCSYIGFGCEFSNCTIGKYCSIGNNVRVVSANHPVDMVSSYPAFYSNTYRVSYVKKQKFIEHITTENNHECEIGNDVWIGDNVLIKGGVKIGNGAIIGMGSLVLHDIPPYSVAVGLPAKVIKTRFDKETCSKLEEIAWWDKSEEWIIEHAEYFEKPEKLLNSIKGV